MNILIIMTGGTISTTVNERGNYFANGRGTVSLLSEEYYRRSGVHRDELHFEFSHPLDILSENMTFDALNTLLNCFRTVVYERYDGIIVAHGTDTLAYTSTLLSLTLAGVWDKPILLVSSDYPLTDPMANGHDNFNAACELIKNGFGAGVYVPYRNSDGVVYLHHGAHLRQCANFTGDFFSSDMVPYMEAAPYKTLTRPPLLNAFSKLEACVMRIEPYVGIDYSDYCPGNNIRAVLHGSYHSATACTEDGRDGDAYTQCSALYMLRLCKERGIDMFLSPLSRDMRATSGKYSTTAELIDNGIQPIYSLTNEAAYIKLALAYSLGYEHDAVLSFIEREICGEMID